MAIDVAVITAGPVRNLTAIENAATDLPHEIIFGCNAMKRPIYIYKHSKFRMINVLTYIYKHSKFYLSNDLCFF
jgi:hypothetical protein